MLPILHLSVVLVSSLISVAEATVAALQLLVILT